jgi:hypothetical protein
MGRTKEQRVHSPFPNFLSFKKECSREKSIREESLSLFVDIYRERNENYHFLRAFLRGDLILIY